jgi:hypothetical protein
MKQQRKTKSLPQQATYWLGVIAVGLTVGLGIQFAQAWTNPGQAPEQGNIPGPITTGASAQTKTGSFTTNGNLNASGWVIASGAMQGQYFRDSNNIAYYANPDGWSVYSNFQTHDNNSWGYIALGEGGAYNSNPGSHVGSLHVNDIYIRAINRWASQLNGLGNISGGAGVNYFRGNTNVDLGWHKLCYINYLHIQEDDFICNLYVDGQSGGLYHWRMGFYAEKNMSCQTYCLD